jgi:hypothetical protein
MTKASSASITTRSELRDLPDGGQLRSGSRVNRPQVHETPCHHNFEAYLPIRVQHKTANDRTPRIARILIPPIRAHRFIDWRNAFVVI